MSDYLTLDEFAEAVGDNRHKVYQRLDWWGIPKETERRPTHKRPVVIIPRSFIKVYLAKRQAKTGRKVVNGSSINKVPQIYHGIEDRRIDKHEWFVITLADRLLRCSWDQFGEAL